VAGCRRVRAGVHLSSGDRRRSLDSDQAALVRQAAQLYKGDLLEGWYQDWCWFERERFQNMYLTLLDKLASYCEAHSDYEAGLDYGTRILQYDRARERTHQQLIRLYMLSGDRASALRQFERCATALQDELGVEPSKYTLALHAQIQSDSLDIAALPSGTLEPDLVKRLENVWKVLFDMQTYLHKETRAIEQLLNEHRADS
jgi:DNA-binding SARP family transcriptional activator